MLPDKKGELVSGQWFNYSKYIFGQGQVWYTDIQDIMVQTAASVFVLGMAVIT